MARKIAEGELCFRLKQVDKMLWQLSWRAWYRLPPEIKIWIDVEDLHQEARLHLVRKAYRWQKKKATWVTFSHVVAANYLTRVIRKWATCTRSPKGAEWVTMDVYELQPGQRTLDPLVDAPLLAMFGVRGYI